MTDQGNPPPPRLPGDPTPAARLAQMIRVDHAGEYGATRIYAGQLAVLGGTGKVGDQIAAMAEQEQRHLAAFDRLVNQRSVRPTVLDPLWRAAGFALGWATATLGPEAAMACTEAVETVIDEHYGAQLAELGDRDPEFSAMIEEFRADERAHRETARQSGAAAAPGYLPLSAAIKAGSRLAIWLSTRA